MEQILVVWNRWDARKSCESGLSVIITAIVDFLLQLATVSIVISSTFLFSIWILATINFHV